MNFTPDVKPEEPLVKPWEWKGVVNRARLDGVTKAVARLLADYGDRKTGRDVYPGVARLVVDSGFKHSAVEKAMAILRKVGLIRLVARGNRRKGLSDEYALALPEDLLDRVQVLSPDEYKAAIGAEAGRKDHPREAGVVEPAGEPAEEESPPPHGGNGSDYPREAGVKGSITPARRGPPTRKNYLPSKAPTDDLALGPQLTTACTPEGEPMPLSPEEIDELKRSGVRGAALVRAAREAAIGERPAYVSASAPPEVPTPSRWEELMRQIEDRIAAALSVTQAPEPVPVGSQVYPAAQGGPEGATA